MADISQVKLPSGNIYNIKDDNFRNSFWDGINPTTADYLGQTLPSIRAGINRLADFTGTTASINNHNHLVAQLEMGSFRNLHGELGTTQSGAAAMNTLCYLYLGPQFSNIASTTVGWNDLYLAVVDSNATTPTTFAGRFMYRRGVLGAKNLTAKGIYPILWNGLDWNIIGDLSQTGQISGLNARIAALESGLSKGIFYTGAVSTAQSTSYNALTDGSTVSKLVINGTTCTFTTQAASTASYSDTTYGPGAIVLKPASTATRAPEEYIWDGTTWQEFGAGGAMGDLAFANAATASYKPVGSVGSAFSGTQATISVKGTPAGSVTVSTASATTATANYTPAGTVNVGIVLENQYEQLPHISGLGSLPSTTGINVTTGVSGGKFVSKISTVSIGKVTGVGSLITTASQDYVTGFNPGDGNSITGITTTNIGKITGVGTAPSATVGTVNQVTGITAQTITTASIYQMSSTGSVGSTSIPKLTSVGSLPTASTTTIKQISGLGTLPSASTGSNWATVTDEVLTLTPVLVSFSAGTLPSSANATVATGLTGGATPSTSNQTVTTAVTLPSRSPVTVVSSVTAASIVSTGTKSVVTNFDAGTLPTCASQTVVIGVTTGTLPTATVETLNKVTGRGGLPTCASQTVVTGVSTANITNSTTQVKSVSDLGALPSTTNVSHVASIAATPSATFSGTPVKINGSFSGSELTSTAAYKPAGSISSTFSGTQATITSYPKS